MVDKTELIEAVEKILDPSHGYTCFVVIASDPQQNGEPIMAFGPCDREKARAWLNQLRQDYDAPGADLTDMILTIVPLESHIR